MDVQEQLLLKMIRQPPLLEVKMYTMYVLYLTPTVPWTESDDTHLIFNVPHILAESMRYCGLDCNSATALNPPLTHAFPYL